MKETIAKIGYCQFNVEFGDRYKNFEKVKTLLKDVEADIIVLPELFTSGYLFTHIDEVKQASDIAGGEITNFMLNLAKEKQCFIFGGFPEKTDKGIYNSSLLAGYDNTEIYYRKAHLFFEEKKFFLPGDSKLVSHKIKLKSGKKINVGLMICFDWIFPETARTLALNGAQLLLHTANLVLPYCPEAMVTRCIENKVFSITANRIGTEMKDCKSLTYIGRSRIISPKGEVLSEVKSDEECVNIVEVDLEITKDKSLNEYNNLFDDRRTDLYSL